MRLIAALVLAGLATTLAMAFSTEGVKKERRICKEVPRSGSNLPERKCLTARQWIEYDENQGDGGNVRVKSGDKALGPTFGSPR